VEVAADRSGDWAWLLACCRGDHWGEGALLAVSTARASLAHWAEHNNTELVAKHSEVADALAEGDRRFPGDPRRHMDVTIGPEPVVIDADPEATALLNLRAAAGEPVAMVTAIAEALRVGVPAESVRATVREVTHRG
jgi:hypothetical protein